jgi:hypothetical protein
MKYDEVVLRGECWGDQTDKGGEMGRKRQSLRVGEDDVKEEVGVTSVGLTKLTVVEKGRRDDGDERIV